jgi:hypothetical protein
VHPVIVAQSECESRGLQPGDHFIYSTRRFHQVLPRVVLTRFKLVLQPHLVRLAGGLVAVAGLEHGLHDVHAGGGAALEEITKV